MVLQTAGGATRTSGWAALPGRNEQATEPTTLHTNGTSTTSGA